MTTFQILGVIFMVLCAVGIFVAMKTMNKK